MNADAEHGERTAAYQVEQEALAFLEALNVSLSSFEENLRSELLPSPLPITIIGGLQRSGTTLLSQLLAQFCELAYIDNLTARFWKAPLVGAMLSRSLFGPTAPPRDLTSDYGVTDSLRGPHEFGYFWTNWLHLDSTATHVLTDEEADRVDWSGLARCLRQISAVFSLPLVLKNPVACWNAPWLFSEYAEFRAIVVRRDPFFVVQSTYLARKERYGDVHRWWSLKPPSYEAICEEADPIRQVVAQVEESRRVFERMLAEHPTRCVAVEYQDLRRRARDVLEELCGFCGGRVRNELVFPIVEDLPDGDRRRVSAEEAERIERALADGWHGNEGPTDV